LLCLDRDRYLNDNFEFPDIFGLKALHKEPIGGASLDSLKNYPSRRHTLDQLVGQIGNFGPPPLQKQLSELLHRATARLGPPALGADLGDPAMMAVHALNCADPANWAEVSIERPDGSQAKARRYVPPETENQRFADLQPAAQELSKEMNIQRALGIALDDPSRSSPEFAATAIAWAQSASPHSRDDDADNKWMREEAVLTAAMIAMRDGTPELRSQQLAWARGIFAAALQRPEDPVYRFRAGLRFNPVAIAFVGIINSLKSGAGPDNLRTILEVAARPGPAAAHGFGAAVVSLAAIDERLPRAVLRCAFAAAIRPFRSSSEEESANNRHRQRVQTAVKAELGWLAGQRSEPRWPHFPPVLGRTRRRRIVLGPQPSEVGPGPPSTPPKKYADHQAAALWLSRAIGLADVANRPWLRDLALAYAKWTAASNGAGLSREEEIANPPMEWNDAYFNLLAYCLPGLGSQEIDDIALKPIASLPDEPFFDIVTRFLRSVDAVFFNGHGLSEPEAVRIRSVLAGRLVTSNGWHRLASSRSASVEVHIGPAIAVFFFNDYGRFEPTKSYLFPKAVDRLGPFLPILEALVEGGPSFFTALVTLNLLEVAPGRAHLPFIVMAANTWLKTYPDNTAFWIDSGMGRRICVLIDNIWRNEPALLDEAEGARRDVDQVLAALVRIGVAEAARLEQALLSP
jgi:hypothetical protein